MGSGCQQHAETGELTAAGLYFFYISGHIKLRHFRKQKFRPEILGLPAHALSQLSS